MAAQNGHTGIVELLISGGASVNNKDMVSAVLGLTLSALASLLKLNI